MFGSKHAEAPWPRGFLQHFFPSALDLVILVIMEPPFAPNTDSAESQTHNEKSPPTNVATQQQDNQTKSKQNENESPPFDSRNPYSQHYQSNAKIWRLYLDETETDDKELAKLWQVGLDQLLIFAGLFGAILTAFLIESRKNLKEDPLQATQLAILQALRNDSTISPPFKPSGASLAVNATWFSSLGLTLISALAAVLARGWLAKYTPATPGMRSNDACERHLRYLRAQQWCLGIIVAAIPFFIQIALFLFAIGLVILTVNDNLGIGITLLIFTVLTTALYFFGTILPWFSPACPFQTTMSDFIPGIAMKPRYLDSTSKKTHGSTPPKPPSLRERISLQWKKFNDFLMETRRKPERLEAEANILAWMLTNTTKDDAMEEAVKAVAGANPSQYIRDALEKDGASRILVDRFMRCVKVVPGLPITGDEERVEAYLYAMLRIVEPSSEGDQENDNVLFMKESLLQVGQPLHRWENYTAYLQPLAFALRTRILLATGCDDDGLQWEQLERDLTKMSMMGFAPYTRLVLVNATAEGLLGGKKHVRKMSAMVLARQLQILDTRYMLAKGNHGDKVVLEMAEILKESGDLNILEGLLRMARCSEFQNSIPTVIHKIVSLLGHKEKDVRVAAEDALLKLKEQALLQPLIGSAIPDIVHMLKSSKWYAPMAGVDVLWKLSKQVECRSFIGTALTEIIALLNDSDGYICAAGIDLLGKLSEHAEFRPLIKPLISDIVKHLNDSRKQVREASADALCNLLVYAEFQLLIGTATSEIIVLLKSSEQYVHWTAASVLSKLSKQAECQPSIGALIPEIIEHLNDDRPPVDLHASFILLSTFADYAEFQPLICTAIPGIITLIKNDNENNGPRLSVYDFLKLSDYAEFRPLIGANIPEMISCPEADWVSQTDELYALSKLSEYDEFQHLIKPAIPQIITLLKHDYYRVRIAGAHALSKISEQAVFQPLIKTAIPQIIALLKDNDSDVQKAGADALSKLLEYAEFQPIITTTISDIITLSKDSALHVQEAGAHAVFKLSGHTTFQALVGTTTVLPEIINLLKDNQTASFSAKFLSKLFKEAEHKSAISNAMWSALKHHDSSQFVANHMEAKENGSAHGVSIGGDAMHLMSYWINDNRFNIASGVCIMAKLHNYAQMCDSQIHADFCTSHAHGESARTCAELSVMVRLSKYDRASNFQRSITTKVSDITQLLKDNDYKIRQAASNALKKLSEESEFQPFIKTAISEIITFLKDYHCYVRKAGADTLSKLSEYAEFQHLTRMAIPGLITLLKDSKQYVQDAGAEALLKISEQAELQPLIAAIIPEIITSLKDSDQDVQIRGVHALSKLSEQTKFQPLIEAAIPEIITLFKNDKNKNSKIIGADLLSRLAEHGKFQSLTKTVIPEIIALIMDKNCYIQRAGVDALSKLSQQTEFQPLIKAAIPEIITLLKDDVDKFRKIKGAFTLSELSEHAEFQPLIETAIPEIISLLRDSDGIQIWRAGANALSKLSEQTKFQPLIKAVIPDIISLLKERNKDFWPAAINFLSKLSIHIEFQPLIRPVIPDIIALLKDSNYNLQRAGADALSKLSEQTEFQPLIEAAIPDIISLLKDSNKNVWSAAADALSKLSIHAEFRPLIRTTIPDIITLLKDREEDVQKPGSRSSTVFIYDEVHLYVQERGAYALSKLSEHAEFQPVIMNGILEVVSLLKASNEGIRQAGANVLLKLSEQNYFLYCHQDFFPAIMAILLSHNTPLNAVPVCTHIFAHHAFNDYFHDKIVQILVFAFDCLYFHDGTHRIRGLSVIEVIAEYTSLIPILHEIWAIYSFTNNILPGVRLEQTKFFIGQMEIYGLLKSL